jgi:hypothetical protein
MEWIHQGSDVASNPMEGKTGGGKIHSSIAWSLEDVPKWRYLSRRNSIKIKGVLS